MKNFTYTFLMPMATWKEKTSNNNYIKSIYLNHLLYNRIPLRSPDKMILLLLIFSGFFKLMNLKNIGKIIYKKYFEMNDYKFN